MHTRRLVAALILGVPSAAWSACIHNNLPVQCPTNPATMQPIPDGSESFSQGMNSTCWRFPMNSGSACTPGINFPPAQPSSPAAGSPPPPPVVPPSPPTVAMPAVSTAAFPSSAREIVALRDPNMTRQLIEQGLARERIEQALSREKPTEKSQTAIEYGMPAALMAVVIIGQLQAQVDSLLKPKEQPNATAVASSEQPTKASERAVLQSDEHTAVAPPAKFDEIDMLLAGLPDDIMSESEEGERERWREMERARDYGHQGMSDEYHRELAQYHAQEQERMRQFQHEQNQRARAEGKPEPYPERNTPSAVSFARDQEPAAGSPVAEWAGGQSPRRVFMPTSEVFIATAGTDMPQPEISGDKITLVIPADLKEPFLGRMVATPDTLRLEIKLEARNPAAQTEPTASKPDASPEVDDNPIFRNEPLESLPADYWRQPEERQEEEQRNRSERMLEEGAEIEQTAVSIYRDLEDADPAKQQRGKDDLKLARAEVKQRVESLQAGLRAKGIAIAGDLTSADADKQERGKQAYRSANQEVRREVGRVLARSVMSAMQNATDSANAAIRAAGGSASSNLAARMTR